MLVIKLRLKMGHGDSATKLGDGMRRMKTIQLLAFLQTNSALDNLIFTILLLSKDGNEIYDERCL